MRLRRDWSGHDPRPNGTRAPGRRPRNPLTPILLCLGFLGCASTLPSPSYPTSRFVLHTEYGTEPSVYYIDYKLGNNPSNKAPVEAQTGSHIQHLSTVYAPSKPKLAKKNAD